jgi:hypothetical protein
MVDRCVTQFAEPNVKYFGVKGDGQSDDTVDLQRAVDTQKLVKIPRGAYKITSPIVLQPGSQVEMERNATIIAGANVNLFQIKPGASVRGGMINCNLAGWNGAAFYLDGRDQFGLTSPTIIDGVRLFGSGTGTAFRLYAKEEAGRNNAVFGGMVRNMGIYGFQTGIHLQAEETADAAWAVVNANYFDNIICNNVVNSVVIQGAKCEGNFFNNITVQTWAGFGKALDCEGVNNVFRFFAWDWDTAIHPAAYRFASGTYRNHLMMNLGLWSVDDGGNNTISTTWDAFNGPVVKTPDGQHLYRIGVDNAGNLTSTLVR